MSMDKQLVEIEDLVGKTIAKVCDFADYQFILVFTDNTYVVIEGDGEELHGTHWPIIAAR